MVFNHVTSHGNETNEKYNFENQPYQQVDCRTERFQFSLPLQLKLVLPHRNEIHFDQQ